MLTQTEQEELLKLARQTLRAAVAQRELPSVHLLPPRLLQPGAVFVTLTRQGELRGCVGSLQAHQPLAEDVREHTVDAALHDYRFEPVTPAEEPGLRIEISLLTPPQPLLYSSPQELLQKLRPGVDGLTLSDGLRRATFLPQVWETLPDKDVFLSHLCRKMGLAPNAWRDQPLQAFIYQAQAFVV